MKDKQFIRNLKEDLSVIYSNLGNLDENELELLLYGLICSADEHLAGPKNKKKKPKNDKERHMIEERRYPADYGERAKYILARIEYHYKNYRVTYNYIKTTKKKQYFGIPPFEFWAIKRDFDLFDKLFKGELKDYRDIFVERYLNGLSLMEFGAKYYGARNSTNKKRAENLNNKFCAGFAKALELQDAAAAQSDTFGIVNEAFDVYKLLKETEKAKPDKP